MRTIAGSDDQAVFYPERLVPLGSIDRRARSASDEEVQ
jgi:hypothetical protein